MRTDNTTRGRLSSPTFLLIPFTSHTENWKQIFPEKESRGHSPNFHIHVFVSDLYIPTINLPVLMQEICGPIHINRSQTHECGNWDCGRIIPFLGIFISNIWYWLFAVYMAREKN
jgi:hypothetical protein